MSILITLLIYALIFGLIWWVISLIPIPDPFGMVIRVVFGIIAVIIIIDLLLPRAGGGGLGVRHGDGLPFAAILPAPPPLGISAGQ